MSKAHLKPKKSDNLRILWGIDPIDDQPELFKQSIECFDNLQRRIQLDVLPVYHMQAQRYNWSGDYSGDWGLKYQPLVEKSMAEVFSAFPREYLTEPQILINRGDHDEGTAPLLETYAKRHRFDWVALNRHARKGADKLFTGSFTEDMMTHSHLPLLIFEPDSKACQWKDIYFPTDFSTDSEELFHQVLHLASSFKSKVTLVHKVVNPIEPFVQSGVLALGGGWVSLPAFVEEQTKEIENRVALYKSRAQEMGVELESILDSSSATVSDILRDITKSNDSALIVMGTKAGGFRSWLGGSVGKQIVRSSHCTVLIQNIGD